MDISNEAKDKLLADLKAGAVNVIALKPIKPADQGHWDEVMGKLRQGVSWLGMVTGEVDGNGVAVFYEWPLAQRMANDYDDLAQLLKEGLEYNILHIEKMDVMTQVLQTVEPLLLERQLLLLFDYSDYPGGARMINFFVVPMEGYEAHDPGFDEVIKKVRGEASE